MNTSIQISTDKSKLNLDFIHAELTKQYWSVGISRDLVAKAMTNSFCFGVYLTESAQHTQQPTQQQIGFARVTTDFATFAYLADVFIQAEFQGKGYAKMLIAEIKAHPQLQGLRRWMLMTRDAHSLYAQFGFTPLANPSRAMEINQPTIYQTP